MNRSEDRVKRRNGVFGRWLGAAVLAAPLIIIGSLPAAAATQTIEVSIAAGNDDAEQRANGSVTLTSSDLELVAENGAAQTVGMRFANINVPPGAAIVSAEIQFTVDEATSGATALTFRAEATDNASVFTTTANSITARPVTTAASSWNPGPWPTVGARGPAQRTPNLAPVVQSVINRPGWQSGNALAIIVTGSGSRVAESFNGRSGSAATLHLEFDFSAPAPPVISAFSPSSASTGGEVVITGSGFTGVTSVQVNGTAAPFTPTADTSITATVPPGATTGPISVVNSAGTAISSTDLTIDPTAPRRVPAEFPTIQGAIDASQDGDVVLVAPGIYHESVVISGKNITLASHYYEDPDPSLIDATVIDTDGTEDAIIVSNTVGAGPTIMGLKLLNPTGAQLDGIRLDGSASILDNHIVQFDDAVDIDSVGSAVSTCTCLRNILELGTDDGFDLDNASAGLYQDNILRDNSEDGVEVRLGDDAVRIDLVFRNNDFLRNGQDGIQIIDEPGASNRVFAIEGNRFIDNGRAAIGLMDNANSGEDYRAASLTDRINLFNNTFAGNNHGLSGGDNVIAVNNIFADSSNIAVKNVDGGSLLAHNLFWNNGTDNSGSNVEGGTTLSTDPLFDVDFGLSPASPAIDAGVASYTWNSELVLDLPPTAYDGSAPDLGAVEFDSVGPQTTITSGPADPSASPDASFSFSSSVSGSTFQCRLDGASFGGCTSPTAYTGLADGTHTFEVRATDPGGNQDSSPASATWTIDTGASTVPTLTEPAENETVTTGTFTVRGAADPGARVTVFADGIEQSVTVADSSSSWATVVNGLSVGAHAITATATDAVGNQSAPSPERSVNVISSTLPPVIASAGDIACDDVGTTRCRQIATSDLILNGNYDAVLTLGDHQYECGSSSEFALGYEPSWGRVKSITRPSVGNHEYFTTGGIDCDATGTAADYFDYFGAAAGSPSEGWYSYDLGDWHVISLNSNCTKIGGCGAGSPQEEWLRADLAANPTACTAAYWHDPRWSSGTAHGSNTATSALVDALYENGVDLILAGHDHHYERFAPQAPDGTADPQYGIREFVVGTGGFSVRPLETIEANSEFQWDTEFGILELTLGSGSYDWAFLTEAGTTPDSGSAPCHGIPEVDTAPQVIDTDPADQATDVPLSSTVSATFNEGMDPGSLTDSTFWLLPEASPPPAAPCPSGECLPTHDLPGWTQIFTDDFTEDIPEGQFPAATNGDWWAYPSSWVDTSGNGNYEPNIISTHDGLLDINLRTEAGQHLVAAPVPNINGPAAGRDQLYGRYAVRFKADQVAGYKTAWLLWPESEVWPRDGEIDFPEGDLDDVIKAFMHRQDGANPGDQDGFSTTETYENWHTAVTEWSPNEVRFILDGVVIGTVTDRIPNTPMHWVLQTETQINGGPPSDAATGHVTIDWVAAWSYSPTSTTAVPATVGYDAGASIATLTPNAALDAGLTYTAVIDGATGANGNPLPVTTWSFRTESGANPPPETTITSGPPDPSPSPDATFAFTANEPATFECSLDGGTPTDCSSPATFTGLDAGPHTFAVFATDSGGEVDPTPATWEWSVSAPAPVTVTLDVTDPDAAESGTDPGEFTITRDGPTLDPLTVQLTLSGTATSNADYAPLPTTVEIPTGQTTTVLTVEPIDDNEPENTETVTITIATDTAYTLGTPNTGTVSITDNDDPPVGQEITLTPVADTWVDQSSPNANFGSAQTLNVDGNANRAEEALLRFDVDGITGSAQSAKLRIFVTNATSNGPTVVLTGTTWTESAVTWNTKPTQVGGVIDDAGTIPSGAYFEFDVTTAITGPGTYSFALIPQSSNGLGFRSREASTSRPQLVITAPAGPDTEPPSVSSLSPVDGASGVSPSAPVRVTFSEAMNPATITSTSLTLSSAGQPVAGSVSYAAGTRTATFTPSSPLTLGQTYVANLSDTVADSAGNRLTNAVSWSFSVLNSLPTEVTIQPVADTYVNGSRPTTNYGSLTTIESDAASQVEQPLLRFDVSGVASVQSAILRIFVSNATTNGPEVYLADNNWDENTVTWATRPAQLSGPHVDAGAIGSGWYELDVTAAITTPGVYTLHLVSLSSDGLRFSSKEGSNPPQLVVTSG